MRALATVAVLVAALSSPVHAQDDGARRGVALTISPLHLLNPELHLTGEFRLAPKLSAAASVGAGSITEEGERYGIWEAGGQIRLYVIGSFTSGLMLGADVGYVDVDGQLQQPMAYLVGARAGGFLGYKHTVRSGFTGEVQCGPVYVRESAENAEWQTLMNLKVGWSF